MNADSLNDRFNHPKNITIGVGRIIWASKYGLIEEGWALPGGRRTTDFDEAWAMAFTIDVLSRR